MEDYLKGVHKEEYSFGHFLKRYVEVIGKLNKDFADDIGIKHTELSQLINNHRSPAEKIIVRLELHSGNVIPALLWMKVADKQREHVINTDKTIRQEQSSHVKNRLEFSH
jgi:plasmid maintenance system antidote protein VapI